MLLLSIGLVCCLFALVLFGAAAALGAPVKWAMKAADDTDLRSQLATLAARIAFPLYLLGVLLTFVGTGRFPSQWADSLSLMALVPAALVLFESKKPIAGRSTVALGSVTVLLGLCVFFVPLGPAVSAVGSPWYGVHIGAAVIGAGLLICATAIAVRRLIQRQFGAKALTLFGIGLGIVVVFSGWVGHGDSRPFLAFSMQGKQPIEAKVVLSERDTGERFEKELLVRADHPVMTVVRDVSKVVLVAGFVFVIVSWFVPTVFYRVLVMISAVFGVLALTSVLLAVLLLGLFQAEVVVDPDAYRAWIEHVQLVGLEPSVVLHSITLPPGPYQMSLSSAPESVILLVFLVMVSLIGALKLLTGWFTTSGAMELNGTNLDASLTNLNDRSAWFEARLLRWALPFWIVALASGAAWGQVRWGRLYQGDPVTLLGLAILLGIFVYFAAIALLPLRRSLPSFIVVGLGTLLGWLLLGPVLGWTVVSLHS